MSPDVPVKLRRLARGIRHAVRSDSSVCKAPSASLYLDQRGDVRACCQNAGFPLGNITQNSLREIWDGERARRLRQAVGAGDLSLGCNFCQWQLDEGNQDTVFSKTFDHLGPPRAEPAWPEQLELSLSNACNLQCIMCNGEWSSSIRTHREHLPPLPVVYDDAFFTELAEFLPHLKVAKFLGGEPFLGKESLRVLDMLAELGTGIPVHVTTNATQWSPRIERILASLNIHLAISLDGVDAATYEAIRVGSSFDGVVENIDRMLAYTSARGTTISLSHCLMTANWQQFDRFLQFAQDRGTRVYVNTVTEPYDLSLYHLPPQELREVVAELERRDAGVAAALTSYYHHIWQEQVDRLRHHLESLSAHQPPAYVAKRRQLGFAWLAPTGRADRRLEDLAGEIARTGAGWVVELDQDGVITAVDDLGPAAVAGPELAVGQPWPDALTDPDEIDDLSVVSDDLRSHLVGPLAVTRVARRNRDGVICGARVLIAAPARGGADPADAEPALDDDPRALGRVFRLVTGRSDDEPAPAAADLAALYLDSEGNITGFSPDAGHLFGTDVAGAVGTSAVLLTDLLAEALGPQEGATEPVEEPAGRLPHHVTRFRAPDGGTIEIDSWFEALTDARSRVWLRRTAQAGSAATGPQAR